MQLHSAVSRVDTDNMSNILWALALLLIVCCRAFRLSILIVSTAVASRFLLFLFLLGAIEAGHAVLVKQVNALWLFLLAVFKQ